MKGRQIENPAASLKFRSLGSHACGQTLRYAAIVKIGPLGGVSRAVGRVSIFDFLFSRRPLIVAGQIIRGPQHREAERNLRHIE